MVLETIDINKKLGAYDLISVGPDLCVPLVLFQEASAIHYLLRNLTHLSTKVDHHAKENHHQARQTQGLSAFTTATAFKS